MMSCFSLDCLEGFYTIDMKNISLDDELKRTLEDIELNDSKFMSFRSKIIEGFYTNDYMFMLSRYKNFRARNYHLKPSNIWKQLCIKESHHRVLLQNEYGKLLKELQMNNGNNFLSLHNNEPFVDVEYTQSLAKEGKITAQLKDNFTSSKYPNKQEHKKSMPKSPTCFTRKQELKCNEIAQLVSLVVVMSIIFVEPFFDMWIEPSLMKLQHGQAWASLLRLLGFMVFVWSVAIMILVGVPFVRMQSFVLIFWAVWTYLKS